MPFNLPITQYTPAQLAEMARLAFKPPALMGGGGGGGGSLGQLPQSQGFNLGQAIGGMAPGLGGLGGSFSKPPPTVEELNQLGVTDPKLAQAMRDSPNIDFRTRQSNTDIADFVNTGTGSGVSGFFGSLFGGGRADGGPVTPGKYYTVGEQGPETFVPSVPGRIVPADQLMPMYREPDRPIPADQLMPMYRDRPIPADQLMPAYRGARDFFGGRRR